MINSNNINTRNIESQLQKLPGIISVDDINIKERIIEHIHIEKEPISRLVFQLSNLAYIAALSGFYADGLTEAPGNFPTPCPVFSPLIISAEDPADRIIDLNREDEGTVLKLVKEV